MTPNRQIQNRPIFNGESQYVEAAAVATTRKLHCCMILALVSGPATRVRMNKSAVETEPDRCSLLFGGN